MSSRLLSGVLDAFITEGGVMSSHISNVKQLATSILAAATKSNNKMQQFDKFAEVLHEILKEAGTLDVQYLSTQYPAKESLDEVSFSAHRQALHYVGGVPEDMGVDNNDTGGLAKPNGAD